MLPVYIPNSNSKAKTRYPSICTQKFKRTLLIKKNVNCPLIHKKEILEFCIQQLLIQHVLAADMILTQENIK